MLTLQPEGVYEQQLRLSVAQCLGEGASGVDGAEAARTIEI